MLTTTIDRNDPVTGRDVAVPADVLAAVDRADAILRERLRGSESDITARWHRFADHGPEGWSVDLTLEFDGVGAGTTFYRQHLSSAAATEREVDAAVGSFTRRLRWWVRQTLKDVGTSLREMIASDAGG